MSGDQWTQGGITVYINGELYLVFDEDDPTSTNGKRQRLVKTTHTVMPAAASLPMGCICPPGAEATCEGPMCPRRRQRPLTHRLGGGVNQ